MRTSPSSASTYPGRFARIEGLLGNHRRQSQQSRLELGLRVSLGLRRTNNLDLLTRIATTESVTLCMLIKSRLRFWNWKRQFDAAPCELFVCGCVLEGNVRKETAGSS
jgi:hypothetical protein